MREFERDLRAQSDALRGNLPDQLVVGDIGNLVEPALAQHIANEMGLGLGIGLGGARHRKLARDVGELLGRNRRIVVADEQIRRRAERRGLVLGIGGFRPEIGNLRGERVRRDARAIALRIGLQADIEIGDRIGGLGGEFRILGREVDRKDARLGDFRRQRADRSRIRGCGPRPRDRSARGESRAGSGSARGDRRRRQRDRIPAIL